MEICFFDKLKKEEKENLSLKGFVDIRFPKEANKEDTYQRRLLRSPVIDNISALVRDNNNIIAMAFASENTWNGLKTVFYNGIFIKGSFTKAEKKDILSTLIPELLNKIKKEGYESLILECEGDKNDLIPLIPFELSHTRNLLNFTIATKDLKKRTQGVIEKIEKSGFGISKGDVNNLVPYLGFMDTRPGWLTSNASMSDKAGDELITIANSFNAVSAICVLNAKTGVVSRLATMPLARGAGYASALLCHVAKTVKTEEVTVVDINKKNIEAIEFLENKGFEVSLEKNEYNYTLD